jgi:hypothetical protein
MGSSRERRVGRHEDPIDQVRRFDLGGQLFGPVLSLGIWAWVSAERSQGGCQRAMVRIAAACQPRYRLGGFACEFNRNRDENRPVSVAQDWR